MSVAKHSPTQKSLNDVATMPTNNYSSTSNSVNFHRFYADWHQRFFRYVLSQLSNFDDDLTNDIVQEVWCEVIDGVGAGRYSFLHFGLLLCKAQSTIADH